MGSRRSEIIQVVTPLVLIAGAAAVCLVQERVPLLRIAPVARPGLTDLADNLLPDSTPARLATTGFSARTAIDHIVYSPDGKLLASVDRQGVLYLWDAANGRQLLSIAPNEREGWRIDGVAFAPDGRSMAAHTLDAILLYDVSSGRTIRRFELESQVHEGKARARGLAFSADGSMLAAGYFDGPITVWDVGSGRLIRSFDADSTNSGDLAFASDGKVLVSSLSWNVQAGSGSRNKTDADQSLLHLWDVGTGKSIRQIGLGKARIGEMAFAPDGKTVAVGMIGQLISDDVQMVIWGDRSIRLYEVTVHTPRTFCTVNS